MTALEILEKWPLLMWMKTWGSVKEISIELIFQVWVTVTLKNFSLDDVIIV